MTRIRKIGGALAPRRAPKRAESRRVPRGNDGRLVRARRLAESASWGLRLVRLGAVLLVFIFFALVWTRPVRDVEVQGLWMASPDLVRDLFGSELGKRWVTVPVGDFEEALEQDPWVREARVSRAPGGRILVQLQEAQPVFSLDIDGREKVVDREGEVLPVRNGMIVSSLPRLDGVRIEGQSMVEEDRARFLLLVHALDTSGWVWKSGLARVDLSNPVETLLSSRDEVEVVVTIQDAERQLAAASSVWHELQASGPARVDLRFSDQIVVSGQSRRSAEGE